MLTTFNEVDCSAMMALRTKYADKFKEKHGIGLGFMSFFTKACATALMKWPAVNASLDEDQIIYHDYADISIAVSTPKGLVVPVIRNAESLSMSGIEKTVKEFDDFIKTFEAKYIPLFKETNLASWNANISGKDEDYKLTADKEFELTKLFSSGG